jgi:uncharacterized DUF497 family protein
MPFEWDQHNRRKVEAHGLTPEEVEHVILDLASKSGPQKRAEGAEPRWQTVGHFADKRIVAIWTLRGGNDIRVVTAWPESRERKPK